MEGEYNMSYELFFDKIEEVTKDVRDTQGENIKKAAEIIACWSH